MAATTRHHARTILSAVSRLAWPAARMWAKKGYFNPPDLATTSPARIAIVACHWIGDTFWAGQVVPALREKFPRAEFLAISQPHCLDLWEGLIEPGRRLPAGEVVSDRRRQRVSWPAIAARARQLRQLDFDLVIDLTGNRYSAAFSFLLRPQWSVGFDGGELGWLYSLKVKDAELPGRHLIERPFRVIAPLVGRFAAPALPIPPQTRYDPQALLERLRITKPFVVIGPGAGWPAKQWPIENFIRVRECLNAAGLAVLAVGSIAEKEVCERLAGDGPHNAAFVGEDLGKVIALLQAARGYVGNDSGLAHLSAAMGRPSAVIFTGATDPALCRPLGPDGCVRVFGADSPPKDIAEHVLHC